MEDRAGKLLFAEMLGEHLLQYRLEAAVTIVTPEQVRLYEGERVLSVAMLSELGRESACGRIEVSEPLRVNGCYRLAIEGCGEAPVIPTGIFDTPAFAAQYHYHGDDLGAVTHGEITTFKLWAPTATRVTLNLFSDGQGKDAWCRLDMVYAARGVWVHTEPCGHGTYYTYTVTTAQGCAEAVDPYAKAVGVNGKRGMVVELARTDPDEWYADRLRTPPKSYSEAVIWEVHVRDFSNRIAASRHKGKYLAFCERGLVNEYGMAVGVDYLLRLGVTHVHLLPTQDYATVDERQPDAQFNWGYDPENYNAPEGSFSSDPDHGEVRIREFKEMVKALHKVGIGVISDVVYNHTFDARGSFDRIVPYYYYRYNAMAEPTSASGCGNDTASERYMYGKFMVDSTAYWIEEYHLDGLRFDLMGLHDLGTMQRIEAAVHARNPYAILYGEGWTMGHTLNGMPQANQHNIWRILPTANAIGGIAVFNDVLRDGLKGSSFDIHSRGYINGNPDENLFRVQFALLGSRDGGYGWGVERAMVVNYMSAHDNHTLRDKLALSNPDADEETRARMNRLGAAIVMLCPGTPFWQAGEEMLRTKRGEENSYCADDAINNLDWSVLRQGSLAARTVEYYAGLIAMRRASTPLTDLTATRSCSVEDGLLVFRISDERGRRMLALLNPYRDGRSHTLSEEWELVADGERAGAVPLCCESGRVTVGGIGVRIYRAGF